MAGPWERYQAQSPQPAGPWQKYAAAGEQSQQPAEQPEAASRSPQEIEAPGWMGAFNAATEATQSGLMGGFDDEIAAGMLSPIDAAIDWAKGKGFDIGAAYTRKQKMLDDQKAARREQHPVASTVGEIAGGLALPGVGKGARVAEAAMDVAKPVGSTVANIIKGGAQGAGYGAVYGAGEAKPGERLEGAAKGAAYGGLTGGVIGGAGGVIANRATRKAAEAYAPTTDELAEFAHNLYRQSEAEGVRFAGPSVDRLKNKLKFAAGGINDKLRPKTAGTVDELDNILNGPISLEALDEFRQGIGLDLKTAQGSDKLRLTRMKQALDEFTERASPQDVTGGPNGIKYLDQARRMWAQHKKAETIDNILDLADVKTGQYTQSGFANAIKTQMRQLYANIQKGKAQGWTKEEVDLIRQMAKGGSPSTLTNIFAKFAPRGVVSIAGGQLVGSTVPVVGNFAVPIAGHLAGKAADRGAMAAAETLRNAAAAGVSPKALPQVPNKLMPLIPGTAEAEEVYRHRLASPQTGSR